MKKIPHAASAPIRVSKLINQLREEKEKEQKLIRFTRPVVSKWNVIYDFTRWCEDRYELISDGEYRITLRSAFRILNSPPDFVYLVYKVLCNMGTFVDDDTVNGVMEDTVSVLKEAQPSRNIWKSND